MSVTLSVQGVPEVARAIRFAQASIRRRVQGTIERYAALVTREAQGLAPVDSGDLRGSIRSVVDTFAAEVIAGNESVTYAAVVELGRRDNPNYPVQPYMGPAFEMHRAGFVRDLKAAAGLTTGAR